MWTEHAGCVFKREGRIRRPFYRNSLLLIRLRLAGKGWFPIPLSLAVLEETLEGLSDLAWFVGRFFPIARRDPLPDRVRGSGDAWRSAGLHGLFRLCAESVNVLRAGGRPYRMVELETEETSVTVDVI